MSNIVVVGSANMDIYVNTKYLPEPGETVVSKNYLMTVGGKGANQAVAAQRLGANVSMIGKIGKDNFGQEILKTLDSYKVNTSHFFIDENKGSGMAVIIVDEQPQNVIAVTPGSNMCITVDEIDTKSNVIKSADIVLAQLEIPLGVIERVAEMVREDDGIFILNPAPARNLSREILKNVDFLTPNQTEAKLLTGIETDSLNGAKAAGKKLLGMGVPNVIITMGSQGAMYLSKTMVKLIPAYFIEDAIDPSGAGDAFMGGFSVALTEGRDVLEAIKFGNLIGGLSTRKYGAMPAMPSSEDAREFIKTLK